MKKTPLNAVHHAALARMVDFGGWDMPVHYGSQIEEHHAVRRDAGMFDVSHMLAVDVVGPARRDFLRRALANDVDKLQGARQGALQLHAQRGRRRDRRPHRLLHARRLVPHRGERRHRRQGPRLAQALRTRWRFDVTLVPRRDLAMIAVQGPNAREKVWQAFPRCARPRSASSPSAPRWWAGLFVARTGYTGEDGFEIMMPGGRGRCHWKKLAAAGVRPCGLGARDTLRLEAGMNLYGQDMDETRLRRSNAGLAWTVDRADGPRLRRPRRARRHAASATVRGPRAAGTGGVLRGHQKVEADAGEGEITSGTFSPTLERSIALARLPAARIGRHGARAGARQIPRGARREAALRAQRQDLWSTEP